MAFLSMNTGGSGRIGSVWRSLYGVGPTLLLLACVRRAAEPSDAAEVRPATEAGLPGTHDGGPSPAPSLDGRGSPATSGQPGNLPLRPAGNGVRVLRFPWRPAGASLDAYSMNEPEDQHQIVLPSDAAPGAAYPVLVAFHGQPKRGVMPRNYAFGPSVIDTVLRAVERRDVGPIVLALPVFRFFGENWPHFDVGAFRSEIDRQLDREGVKASLYYAIGHSGAAGCGGDGMNRVSRMRPAGVGFFDTCLGRGWRDEVQRLREARIPTLMVHSLETAGFSPRQPTEYSPTFDFGRAYGPAGLFPSECPAELPRAPFREQPFHCSADREGIARGLIVDSGEGEEGHNALVPIALEYFLRNYVRPHVDQR